jgi:hypothetical protein
LPEVAKLLDSETTTGLALRVSVVEAQDILNAMIGRDECCTPDEAQHAAQSLIGLYPAREVHDAKTYASGVTALMAAYPLEFVRRVCSPVHGIPSRLKWLPTIAEIKTALDDERTRRGRIAFNARYLIEEKRKAQEAAEFERNRPAADERARRAQEIIREAAISMDLNKQIDPPSEPERASS